MTGLEEISVDLRDGGHTEPGYEVERRLSRGTRLSQDLVGETKHGMLGGQPVDGGSNKIDQSAQEDHRARFYEHYRKEAEGYDKDFIKKYDDDMSSILIFAGLFSVVTSVFIIQIQSQLQPDPNEETAALLRILIYKIDNTTFGSNVPALPQWTGPSQTIVDVLSLLYASLAVSLLSGFLAILGKQWLNRYASMYIRESVVERSHNRQRKLDGIIRWYFDSVLESIPLMSQTALLLLGMALSRYLWDISITVASVVLGVTSFGVLFYVLIIVAGATSDSCPYQTPGAFVLRHTPNLFRPAYTLFVKHSEMYGLSAAWWAGASRLSAVHIIRNILAYPFVLLFALAVDVFNIGRGTFRSLVGFARQARNQPRGIPPGTPPIPDQVLDDQVTKLDFRCSFWMLRTSPDKAIKVSTLNFLGAILSLAGSNSTINSAVVADCFSIFSSCFITRDDGVAIVTRGSEQLAESSAMCFLRAFSSLSITEPMSTVIRDVHKRYERAFPSRVELHGLPRPIIVSAVHHLFAEPQDRTEINWRDYNPTTDELIPFSRSLAQAAQLEYHRAGDQPKVPRWLVRFALRFLSQSPLPPTPVVVDCLTVIATDLGCTLPDANRMTIGDRSRIENLFTSIIQRYETIASREQRLPGSKGKATIAFLSYASQQEENGVVIPTPLKYAVVDAFRHSHSFLGHASTIGTIMQHWITAASTLPYTNDLCESVVDTLLQMAFQDNLRPHIPVEAWDWLKKRPVLRPNCQGLKFGASLEVFQSAQEVGDLELTTSYLFVVWSKWSWAYPEGFTAMLEFIRSGLLGIEGLGYREDLVQRLDDVLSQMNSGSPTPPEAADNASWYTELRTALEEVNEEAMKMQTGSHSTPMGAPHQQAVSDDQSTSLPSAYNAL